MRGKRANNTTNGIKPIIILISILIIFIVIIAIYVSNKDNSKGTIKTTSSYISTNTETKPNSYNSTTTTTHYCDASGCNKKGIYSIDGVSGKEYYCYEHYKQMEALADMIMGY